MLLANLVGSREVRVQHLAMIADVFNGNLIVMPVLEDGNYLVFAFRDASFEPRRRWIQAQAGPMQARYGLDCRPRLPASTSPNSRPC